MCTRCLSSFLFKTLQLPEATTSEVWHLSQGNKERVWTCQKGREGTSRIDGYRASKGQPACLIALAAFLILSLAEATLLMETVISSLGHGHNLRLVDTRMITWIWRGTYSKKGSQAMLVSSCWLIYNSGQGPLLLLGHVYNEAKCTLVLKDNWLGLKGTKHISSLFITPESTSHKTPQHFSFCGEWASRHHECGLKSDLIWRLNGECCLRVGCEGEAASGIKEASPLFCGGSQTIG